MLKILHLAALNFAGVPYDFYRMHNQCGDYSRLITFHKNPHAFKEDICLNLPLPKYKLAKLWRDKKTKAVPSGNSKADYFKYKNIFEKAYFDLYDIFKTPFINRAIEKYSLNEFDIIHYDSGLDFYRNSKQALKWKKQGKKIVCCYYGSDLRTRGIIKQMEDISDLNITSEFDHLAFKNNLEYIFYPYDTAELPAAIPYEDKSFIRIAHSPTNRLYKGTDLIISVIERIKKEKKIEFLLLENISRSEVLNIKRTADICIDQVGGKFGGTGYGKSGLETLGMGIPTVTNMTKEYHDWLPDNPFIVANTEDELYNRLNELIDNPELRNSYGNMGKEWVHKYHSYESVNNRLIELYRQYNII